jgi:hypothetical protein
VTDEIADDLDTAAAAPRSATVDGNQVTAHPLPDLVEADRYLRSRGAGSRGIGAFIRGMMAKIRPPGP